MLRCVAQAGTATAAACPCPGPAFSCTPSFNAPVRGAPRPRPPPPRCVDPPRSDIVRKRSSRMTPGLRWGWGRGEAVGRGVTRRRRSPSGKRSAAHRECTAAEPSAPRVPRCRETCRSWGLLAPASEGACASSGQGRRLWSVGRTGRCQTGPPTTIALLELTAVIPTFPRRLEQPVDAPNKQGMSKSVCLRCVGTRVETDRFSRQSFVGLGENGLALVDHQSRCLSVSQAPWRPHSSIVWWCR